MFGTREPLHHELLVAGSVFLRPDYNTSDALALPKALLWRASGLAVENALRFGQDLPVGASIGNQNEKIGGFFASDRRTGEERLHAERYALTLANAYQFTPEFLGVNIEPCNPCQQEIEACGVNTCYFVVSRDEVSARGLVNERPGVLDGPEQERPPYYMQIIDESLTELNITLLDNVQRNVETGEVVVNREKLLHDLNELAFVSTPQ